MLIVLSEIRIFVDNTNTQSNFFSHNIFFLKIFSKQHSHTPFSHYLTHTLVLYESLIHSCFITSSQPRHSTFHNLLTRTPALFQLLASILHIKSSRGLLPSTFHRYLTNFPATFDRHSSFIHSTHLAVHNDRRTYSCLYGCLCSADRGFRGMFCSFFISSYAET